MNEGHEQMIRFYQSILGTSLSGLPPSPENWGDCTRACFASVLHIDPAELPNPHGAKHLDWGLEWFKALAPYGVVPIWTGEDNMEAWWRLEFPGYWIASVQTRPEEGGDIHCVVMLHDTLAHDPMPGSPLGERDFKEDVLNAIILLPVDPSKAVVRR
jgi:hypothetical protein